jgi:hypothetical protein
MAILGKVHRRCKASHRQQGRVVGIGQHGLPVGLEEEEARKRQVDAVAGHHHA